MTKSGEDEGGKAEVEKVAHDHGMTAPSFLDTTGAWTKSAGVMLEPTFLLIDREGRLAYRHAGKLTIDGDAYQQMNAVLQKM